MKNTLNQSIVLSNSTPTTISSQHACYLLFFLDNRCEIAALKKQFALTPLQVVEFLTSKSVRAAIGEMHETIRASLAVQALKARDFAIDKLKLVCTDLIRQTTITAGAPINESAHAKAINHLRLATSQLGRFAAAAIAPPEVHRKDNVKIEQISAPITVDSASTINLQAASHHPCGSSGDLNNTACHDRPHSAADTQAFAEPASGVVAFASQACS